MSEFEQDWKQWHIDREASYGDPLGWVSLTGLHWLTEEFETIADLPGHWKADANSVTVQDFPGTETVDPVEGAPGILVDAGDRRIEVIRRTGSVALRVHDPKAPTLTTYSGIPAYEPNSDYVVEGSYTPYSESRTVTTGAVVEGLEHHHTAVGTIDFEVDGSAQQVIAFGGNGPDLRLLFTDGTSGVTTYPAARILSVAAPTDGTVVLDFNRASNLPCAFTDYATCPVAPVENKLTVAIEAGEKNPR